MKTACLYFAVLVPHRDCLLPLEDYRRSLFAAGFAGAFAFPAAAPLALLSRPLSKRELKDAALNMRSMLGKQKLQPGPPVESLASGGEPRLTGSAGNSGSPLHFFGLSLDLPPPSLPEDAVISLWEKPPLAPAVLGPGGMEENLTTKGIMSQFSFRAAALANLTLWSAECGEPAYSFRWEIGPLFWLPKPK
jgi:hypothetical protein